jgi:MFS family permease
MTATRDESRSGQRRALSGDEKAWLGLLALPTFALALSITVVSTQLGEVTRHYTRDTILIGLIIGGEGVMALWIPVLSGTGSDALRTRIGGRLPFLLAGTLPAAAALALIGFVHSLVGIGLVAAAFFAFYFVAYEPYRAMYPDVLPESVAGRGQSAQAVARGLGTGVALLGGGLLLSVARPLPFLVTAIVLITTVALFAMLVLRRGVPRADREADAPTGLSEVLTLLRNLFRDHPALRAYFVANALWEAALAGLKAFIILYLTIGLRVKLGTASLIVGGVALLILVGAAATGKAADRYGRIRVVRLALIAYGLGYLVPIFTTSHALIAVAVPFIAIGGGAVMTLAYALLIPLMPEDEHGALTGFYSLSRGVGIVAGPILAGLAISLTGSGPFRSTHGFQAMWIVCAAVTFVSLIFVRYLRDADRDREELRSS